MDSLSAMLGQSQIRSDSGSVFDLLGKKKHLYSQITDHEAWLDFMSRLVQLREGTRAALERGVIDNHGHTHEPEQRAVLYVVESLLDYVPSINRDFDQLLASMQSDEAISGIEGLYGEDRPMGNLTSLT